MEYAAILISICALALTVFEAVNTRKHNRLSVRPHLGSHTSRNRDDKGITIELSVLNTGIGPAIIKETRFFLDGSPAKFGNLDPIEALAEACFNGKVPYQILRSGIPGNALLPGDACCLARIFFPNLSRAAEPLIEQLTSRADYEIAYESFYGEKFTLSTKSP